jgi:hypothetical protein
MALAQGAILRIASSGAPHNVETEGAGAIAWAPVR